MTTLFLFNSINLNHMAKIKSGVLGGYSGTIGSVTGYRRNGKDIIQGINQRENFELTSVMVARHNMIKNFNTWFLQWNVTWRVRFINTLNPITPKDERLRDDFYQEYGRFNKLYDFHGNIFGIKTALLTGAQHRYNPTTKILHLTWINVPQPVNIQGSRQTTIMWIDLDSTSTQWLTLPKNSQNDTHNFDFTAYPSGRHIFAQVGFINAASQNPSNLTALPAIWFTT